MRAGAKNNDSSFGERYHCPAANEKQKFHPALGSTLSLFINVPLHLEANVHVLQLARVSFLYFFHPLTNGASKLRVVILNWIYIPSNIWVHRVNAKHFMTPKDCSHKTTLVSSMLKSMMMLSGEPKSSVTLRLQITSFFNLNLKWGFGCEVHHFFLPHNEESLRCKVFNSKLSP